MDTRGHGGAGGVARISADAAPRKEEGEKKERKEKKLFADTPSRYLDDVRTSKKETAHSGPSGGAVDGAQGWKKTEGKEADSAPARVTTPKVTTPKVMTPAAARLVCSLFVVVVAVCWFRKRRLVELHPF